MRENKAETMTMEATHRKLTLVIDSDRLRPRLDEPSPLDARDRQICHEFATSKNITKADLAAKWGMSVINLRRILKRGGVDGRQTAHRSRAFADKRALSQLHARLGHIISYARCMQLEMTAEEFSEEARLTAMRLRAIELGFKSPTIDELERIAAALKLSVSDLVDPKFDVLHSKR
jgi:transcriptional regulator with XRE-family HTH domain